MVDIMVTLDTALIVSAILASNGLLVATMIACHFKTFSKLDGVREAVLHLNDVMHEMTDRIVDKMIEMR